MGVEQISRAENNRFAGLYWMSWDACLVPGAGVEPARMQYPRDFKSRVSTNSTIPAHIINCAYAMEKSKAGGRGGNRTRE